MAYAVRAPSLTSTNEAWLFGVYIYVYEITTHYSNENYLNYVVKAAFWLSSPMCFFVKSVKLVNHTPLNVVYEIKLRSYYQRYIHDNWRVLKYRIPLTSLLNYTRYPKGLNGTVCSYIYSVYI